MRQIDYGSEMKHVIYEGNDNSGQNVSMEKSGIITEEEKNQRDLAVGTKAEHRI